MTINLRPLPGAMSSARPLPTASGLAGRVVAFLAAGLVLLLSTSAVSPVLHAWLHDAAAAAAHSHAHACPHHGKAAPIAAQPAPDDAAADHECAVTLFAHGVVHAAALPFVAPCEGILRAVDFPAVARLALASPRWLHLPPQAPPAV
jgi:hypothetical protein